MSDRPFNYSYSLISSYLTCPQRMYKEKVEKSVPFTQNEAALWGSQCHDAMDKAIKSNTLPEGRYAFLAPTLSTVYKVAGDVPIQSEYGYGLTEQLEPTTFRAGYLKGKLDCIYRPNSEIAVVLDWKVARYSATRYTLEGEVFSYLTLKSEPEIKEVRTAFIWLKEECKGPTTKAVQHRKDINELEDGILGKIATIERSLQFDNWPCKPSGLCSYCPVKTCKFWKPTRK